MLFGKSKTLSGTTCSTMVKKTKLTSQILEGLLESSVVITPENLASLTASYSRCLIQPRKESEKTSM